MSVSSLITKSIPPEKNGDIAHLPERPEGCCARMSNAPVSLPPVSLASLRVDGRFFARASDRATLRGVTYGPFAPNANGEAFPEPAQLRTDCAQIVAAGFNAVRLYTVPSPQVLEQFGAQENLGVWVDIPWSKHCCFLDDAGARREARLAVERAAKICRNHPAVLAYSIGNEIPADIVRWHGVRNIERFLRDLADVARQADPSRLITYTNFPPTEYLDLSFLDFATFNVYLHDPATFRRYMLRLLNLVGDKPLVLGEIGMDTLRHSEAEQAQFLAGHCREAALLGVAGLFAFSWTDEWFTGGHLIDDWAFGITRADRSPKPALDAMQKVMELSACELLPERPMVSVIVCSYNGGATLKPCLDALLAIDYPNYEVILVDDGSTDDTPQIAARYPQVRTIRQANLGLSAARNVGLKAARGAIVAYTDSDCLPDRDWLTFLVSQLQQCDAAAVGGPNLAPESGRVPACVAAAPGQPMHVLANYSPSPERDQVAEHIPGCNMAFRREALEAINGFDDQFRKAGDDVDICWRLEHAGYWTTFAPAAVVWHYRRQTPSAYFKQQAGYGEAEALLRFKHPDRFNGRGHGKWQGSMYGNSLQGLVIEDSIIYHGTFGTAPFQCIYQPGTAHWAMLPSTFEWHLAVAAMFLLGLPLFFFGVWPFLFVAAFMLILSVVVAGLQAYQAKLAPQHEGLHSRALVAALCYAQPLVRSWARYQRRYFAFQAPAAPHLGPPRSVSNPLARSRVLSFWGTSHVERTEYLRRLVCYLDDKRCGKTVDTGWSKADLDVFRDFWCGVSVCTAQEDHGSGNRVIRVRLKIQISLLGVTAAILGVAVTALAMWVNPWMGAAVACAVVAVAAWIWKRGIDLLARMTEVCREVAGTMGLVACDKKKDLGFRMPDLGYDAAASPPKS
jgi:GT2 family glycosyltransferase